MRRKVLDATVVAIAVMTIAGGVLAQETKTLQGEVVDPASYLKDGRHGVDLEDQTYEAVDGGQTLALLEDGTGNLYLLLGEEAGEDPNELVYDYVNQEVKITGTIYERGGVRGIVAASVEPLTPPAEPPANAAAPATPPAPATPTEPANRN